MKLPSKTVITLISIPVLILLFFSSNIYGYFRFKHYCSTEGGLRVYEELERNVGWWAKDEYDAKLAAQLEYVSFVRYSDQKNNKNYDVYYLGGNPNSDISYKIEMSDASKKIKYKWLSIYEHVPDESRLDKFGQKVISVVDGKILVTSYSLKYEFFNRDHMILDMAHKNYCPAMDVNANSVSNAWLKKFNKAFINRDF